MDIAVISNVILKAQILLPSKLWRKGMSICYKKCFKHLPHHKPQAKVKYFPCGIVVNLYTGWHKKTGTFEKPNKNWRNPRKKIYCQKLNHY